MHYKKNQILLVLLPHYIPFLVDKLNAASADTWMEEGAIYRSLWSTHSANIWNQNAMHPEISQPLWKLAQSQWQLGAVSSKFRWINQIISIITEPTYLTSHFVLTKVNLRIYVGRGKLICSATLPLKSPKQGTFIWQILGTERVNMQVVRAPKSREIVCALNSLSSVVTDKPSQNIWFSSLTNAAVPKS